MNEAAPSLSEMIITAVFDLQRQNGLSVNEISCFLAEKTGKSPRKVLKKVDIALKKAAKHKILSKERGLYTIDPCYDDTYKEDEG